MKRVNPTSPPPIALLPGILTQRKPKVRSVVAPSVTQQVIANYWKQRHMIEEDHLTAAIKTVAHIRSQNLSHYDYLHFVESLELEDYDNSIKTSSKDNENEDARVGIKDWWTESIYAYLNEPDGILTDNTEGRLESNRVTQTALASLLFC